MLMKQIQTDRSLASHTRQSCCSRSGRYLAFLVRGRSNGGLWSLLGCLGLSLVLCDVCTAVGITRTAKDTQAPELFWCF